MELNKKQYTIDDLFEILSILRGENGCPWDRVQTHESIKKNMIEECYEAVDALDNGSDKDFANELGDVLLQVAFHSQLAQERGAFDFNTVLNELCTKLIARHTHVFGADKAGSVTEALDNWEKNKKKEKALKTNSELLRDVPGYLPALMRAEKIQKKAESTGFDMNNIDGAYKKIYEKADEIKNAEAQDEKENKFGELLFEAVNLGRLLRINSETALSDISNKFIDKFEKLENEALRQKKDILE